MIIIENGQVFSSEGKHIHRHGSECYFSRCTALPGDTPEDFEEVDELPAYTEREYTEKVQELISVRYSYADELAIQRQRLEKPEEFKEYFDYCEDCKVQARRILSQSADQKEE